MRLTYLDYTNLVMAAYKRMLQNGELSPLLATITRGNIRQQCLNVYKERTQNGESEERNVLEAFFGVPPEGKNFALLIEFFDLDKFRQIEKLLKKGLKNPGVEDIELLAWLINFPHRPYGREVLLDTEELKAINTTGNQRGGVKPKGEELKEDENEIIGEEELTSSPDPGGHPESINPEDEIEPVQQKQGYQNIEGNTNGKTQPVMAGIGIISGKKWLVPGSILGFLAVSLVFIFWQPDKNQTVVKGNNTSCMYWTGDHYEETPCDLPQAGRLVIKFDKEKKDKFKRILRVDTITEWSVNKIFYIQNNGVYELYTAGGKHPIDTTRYLRKLSQTVFNNQFGNRNGAFGIKHTDSIVSGRPISYSGNLHLNSCKAITKKGKQCSRKPRSGGYCWQHGG